MLQEFPTCILYFQQAVVFDLLDQIPGNNAWGITHSQFVFFSQTETNTSKSQADTLPFENSFPGKAVNTPIKISLPKKVSIRSTYSEIKCFSN